MELKPRMSHILKRIYVHLSNFEYKSLAVSAAYDFTYKNTANGYEGIEATHYNKYGAFIEAAYIAELHWLHYYLSAYFYILDEYKGLI